MVGAVGQHLGLKGNAREWAIGASGFAVRHPQAVSSVHLQAGIVGEDGDVDAVFGTGQFRHELRLDGILENVAVVQPSFVQRDGERFRLRTVSSSGFRLK